LFSGDYADPSIVRVGEDFYMTHSSFYAYPGLLIWHSKDLTHWSPIVRALKKNVGTVWAPEIVYYKELFYIYFPVPGTNFVITAKNPAGPWSDPIDLHIPFIDPGHIVSSDGKRYLYFSEGYSVELASDGLSVVGTTQKRYDGWTFPHDWNVECFCLEAPKFFKKGQYYYQIVAQGGTAGPATSHMAVLSRSKSALGPWNNAPDSPLLRTYNSSEKWWSKGHATYIDDLEGKKMWIVYHAYEKDHLNMGRQTIIEPVSWDSEGWMHVDTTKSGPGNTLQPGGFTDNFKDTSINLMWSFYKNYDAERFEASSHGLKIKAQGESPNNSTPLIFTPVHHNYEAILEAKIEPGAQISLLLFYNSSAYVGIYADKGNIGFYNKYAPNKSIPNSIGEHLFLKLKNINNVVEVYYSADGTNFDKLMCAFEVSGYHHNVLGDFQSLKIAIAACGNGNVILKQFKYNLL